MASAESKPLSGRVAVVTGGGRGIGRGIALRLAREGAHCVITYRRSADTAAAAVAEIEREGVKGLALPLELAEPAQVPSVFERIGQAFGRVDILIANAAATSFRPLAEQKEHNVRRTFAITVDSFIAAVQGALPLMRGRPGRIVIISGIDSFHSMPGHGLLGGAKAAAESLVRAFAGELGPHGITVNGVNPGMIVTDSSRLYVETGLGRDYETALAEVAAVTPVRRVGTIDDVADCVAWMVSDGAGFLTGQIIVLDGGLTSVSPLARLAGPQKPACSGPPPRGRSRI